MFVSVLYGCDGVVPRIYTGRKPRDIKKYFSDILKLQFVKIEGDIPYEVSYIKYKHTGSYKIISDKEVVKNKMDICLCIPPTFSIFSVGNKVIDVKKDIIQKLLIS